MAKCGRLYGESTLGAGCDGKEPHGSGEKRAETEYGGRITRITHRHRGGWANRHDIKLLEETLRSIVIAHPEGAKLCLDAGYVSSPEAVEGMGYEAHIRSCGEERRTKEQNPLFKARRWVVEVCHSWLNRFRKLLVRYEKKVRNYQALVEFAGAVILWQNLIPVHPGLIPGKALNLPDFSSLSLMSQ
jgi:IS5 family transposase